MKVCILRVYNEIFSEKYEYYLKQTYIVTTE